MTNFGQSNIDRFGSRCVSWSQKVGPKGGCPESGGPKFVFFFHVPPLFSLFSSLSGGLFVEFWWCSKRRALKCSRSGCLVKPSTRTVLVLVPTRGCPVLYHDLDLGSVGLVGNSLHVDQLHSLVFEQLPLLVVEQLLNFQYNNFWNRTSWECFVKKIAFDQV